MKAYKTIALFSGGLDSILAVKWMQSRGYTVFPVFFRAPYLKETRALLSAEQNGLDLQVVDVTEEHLQLLYKPVYGFGKRMNPCIDCHGFMFRKAAELMQTKQADFIISGEVLGQRPMSQRRDALDSVSRLSGIKDLIIRPLSQALLPDTKPVREGWIERSDLLSFHGRGRYAQLNLANKLQVKDFPPPAGGCLLTDRNYCLRLQDLMEKKQESRETLELLSYGRHFRLNENLKLIVGRDETDNINLEKTFSQGYRMLAKDVVGPLGLLVGEDPDAQSLEVASKIFLYYHPKVQESATIKIQEFKDSREYGTMREVIASKGNASLVKQFRLSYD